MDKGTYLGHFHCNSINSVASKSLVNMLLGQGYKHYHQKEPFVRVKIYVIIVLCVS
jgi:hypothetical protein